MRQQNFKGPKLPQELREKIGDPGNRPRGGRPRSGPLNRKERRKAEREDKKKQRKQPRGNDVRRPVQNAAESDTDEEDPFDDDEPTPPPPPSKRIDPATDADGKPLKSILKTTAQPDKRKRSEKAEESPPPAPRVSRAVQDRLAEEEAEIRALEKKLGIRKKKAKAVDDDGLDDIFAGLGGSDSEDDGFGASAPAKRKRPEDEDWLASKRRKALGEHKPADDVSDDESGSDDGMEFDDDDGESLEGDLDEELEDDEDEDEDGMEYGSDFDSFDEDNEPAQPRVRENPYAPPVAPDAAPPAKYIPPSLRGPPSSDAEALSRLKRQAQGLLNRLSEANMLSILKDIEQLYQNNPRGYVNTTLVDLLTGLLADPTTLQDTFLILHAGFIAAIYKVIGTDFGAQMVERIVSEFDRSYQENKAGTGKQSTNLMSLVAELYIFQVIGSNLLFDYIKLFLSELSEINTELLLRVVRIAGQQLRQDDPSSLKDIVLLLQKSVSALGGESTLSTRTKFMIETINSLKNNRMKTGMIASSIVTEHTTRIKKALGSLNTRSLKGTEPLRIGLSDIRNTEKKGKWWLVGASWRNDKSDEISEQHDTSTQDPSPDEDNETILSTSTSSTNLQHLARENGMNTSVRRAIFITMLSATDYKEAHIRLLKLRLKKSQELEIPRVLIHCAGAEEVYNPYYTLLARKLCAEHRIRKAFQFGLWDFFGECGEKGDREDEDGGEEKGDVPLRKIVNLGKLYGTLFANHGLPITSLKVLNFAYLQDKTRMVVEIMLVTTILEVKKGMKEGKEGKSDDIALRAVFGKVDKERGMVAGLLYFVRKVLRKTGVVGDKRERRVVEGGCRVIMDVLSELGRETVGEE